MAKKLNYVWNYLSSTLSNFRVKLLGYKSYAAQIGQVGTDPITAIELANDFGNITYTRQGPGLYTIDFPTPISRHKLFIPTSTDWLANSTITYPISDGGTIIGYIFIYPKIDGIYPWPLASGIFIDSQDLTFNSVELETMLNAGGHEGRLYIEFKVYN